MTSIDDDIAEEEETIRDTTPWYFTTIDYSMMSAKASYFFQNAKDSCYMPYMMLFLTGIGLDTAKAGQINGLRLMGYVIGGSIMGYIS